MKLSKYKVRIARARACMSTQDIATSAEIPLGSVKKACAGYSVKPENIGKIARALGVDVLDILADDSKEGE